jgi:hypothetical protein
MVLRDVEEVIGDYTGLSRTVLEYSQIVKRIVDIAKQPGYSADSWAPLAELCAVDDFVRVGNFKEVMNWQEYVAFLTDWAAASEWDCSFKRITEANGVVFLELEERVSMGDFSSVVNSMSTYEFNSAGKLQHIDVYLQMAMPGAELLQSYDGIQISE